MASKENKFAKSEGGAMLTPNNNAQSSFGLNVPRNQNNIGMNNRQNNAGVGPQNQAGDGGDSLNNGEENSQNQGDNNKNQQGASTNGKQGENNSSTDELQKKALKEGGKVALMAAGAPAPVADKVVETAEKTGALDKINAKVNEIKKKKLLKFLPLLSGLLPIAFGFIMVIMVLSIVMAAMTGVESTAKSVINFFTSTWEDFIGLFSPDYKSEAVFLSALPKVNANADSEEKKNMSKYLSAIMGSVYYEATTLNSNGTLDTREYAFYRGLSRIAEITYNGLNSSAGRLRPEVIATKIATLNEELPLDYIKDENGNYITDENGNKTLAYAGTNYESVRKGQNSAWDKIQKFVKALKDDLADLAKAENGGYTFDFDGAFKPYLDEYIQKNIIDTKISTASMEVLKENLLITCNYYEEQLKTAASDEETASASGEDIISYFGSIYGDQSCAMLTKYEPNNHEFTESQGISDKKIHSIYDGEVIYVNQGINLYDKWDSKTQRCLCDGKICDNYNGSQIKIKFVVDEIEYIATYSNMATTAVEVGDSVSKGEVIGTEGNTGCTNIDKLTFQLTSESGINYNTNDLLYKCSSFANTANTCNFNNLKINLLDCNNKTLIKQIPFYDYVKEQVFVNHKQNLSEIEYVKAAVIISANNILKSANYQVGVKELDIEVCDYKEKNIIDSSIIDSSIDKVRGQIMTYNKKIVALRFNDTCNRTFENANANSIYNLMCSNNAFKMAQNGKSYTEILNTYYPNYQLDNNYCVNYADNINEYSLKNDKQYLTSETYTDDEYIKFEKELKEKINMAGFKTRAAAVETARYLSLGLDSKIAYKVGGNYFYEGLNKNWYVDGLDSCGFISWVLFNAGANIEQSMNVMQLISSQNITGNLKITNEFYKYYDKVQVGDFAWKEGHIGIIIGKNDGLLYIAEANSKEGLIVTTITAYGESSSNYTHIYFADNYYDKTGNITSMW